MNDYKIFIDLAADIDAKFLEDNEIGLIPMEYSLGKDFIKADHICSAKEIKDFYDSQRNGDLTKTTQITPYMYQEIFDPYLKKGISILYLPLSSGLSSTYRSALNAKAALEEEYQGAKMMVVDTLQATSGIGILAELAVINKKNGMSLDDNAIVMQQYASKCRLWFMVDDLNYLKRGGRISAATAIFGRAFKIKPILRIDEQGKLTTVSKKRGNNLAIEELLRLYEENHEDNTKLVYIAHADNEDVANKIKEEILKKHNDYRVVLTFLSPIIGSHTGPGMVCIGHISK